MSSIDRKGLKNYHVLVLSRIAEDEIDKRKYFDTGSETINRKITAVVPLLYINDSPGFEIGSPKWEADV